MAWGWARVRPGPPKAEPGAGSAGRGAAGAALIEVQRTIRQGARSSGAIDIAAVGDVYYRHLTGLIVDPVDHPVGATAALQPPVTQRHLEAEAPNCVGGVYKGLFGKARAAQVR